MKEASDHYGFWKVMLSLAVLILLWKFAEILQAVNGLLVVILDKST
ncbi:MAG: hypothetical protein VXW65_10615 [Pseudomonadota bacterium]|nr:hypothetical protein [Pseudomonadota bacterium]